MFIFKVNGRIFGGYCEWVNWNGFVSGEKTYLFFINELFNKRSKLYYKVSNIENNQVLQNTIIFGNQDLVIDLKNIENSYS